MTPASSFLALVGDRSAPLVLPPVGGMRDQELLDAQREVAEVQRRVSAVAAALAGEIAHRSRRELGHSGLAASRGQRSAEGLISQLTGSSTRDARTLVKAGELLPFDAPRPSSAPVPEWLQLIGDAVARASISTDAVEVIRTRLSATAVARAVAAHPGEPDAIPGGSEAVVALVAAARDLVEAAPNLTIEQLAIRAGRVRDELDLAGVEQREREQHDRRFLRLTPLPDGMVRLTGLLDRESAAIVTPIVDAITSPRRSGPRFVDPDAAPVTAEQVRDERTPDQLVLDSVIDLIRCGSQVDEGRVFGDAKPAVRILVTARDLNAARDVDTVNAGAHADSHAAGGAGARPGTAFSRPGAAYFEGQTEPVSIATAERLICATGAVPILFDDDTGRVLNLGREQRLFSKNQRIALAARDGGCLMCDRPPSFTEAHHIDHWDQHAGRTDIDDGVLLCRFCHLLVHNRGWRIRREHGEYSLERPDQNGTLRRTPLPSRSPALERLRSTG